MAAGGGTLQRRRPRAAHRLEVTDHDNSERHHHNGVTSRQLRPTRQPGHGGRARHRVDLAATFFRELRSRLEERSADSLARRLGRRSQPDGRPGDRGLRPLGPRRHGGVLRDDARGPRPSERPACGASSPRSFFVAAQDRWQSDRQLQAGDHRNDPDGQGPAAGPSHLRRLSRGVRRVSR